MNKLTLIILIVVAVSAVAVADVLEKEIAVHRHTLMTAIKDPLIIPVIALYIAQIIIFLYVFVKREPLGIVGIIQTALYAVIVIGSSFLFFKEKITPTQAMGMALALAGVILMNK